MSVTDELAEMVADVAAHPTDEVRWLLLAEWLDDRSDSRGADIRRWWKVRPDLVRAWWQRANRRLDKAAAACVGLGGDWWRLCACLNWRLCGERWPVPYHQITTWPEGWSSGRHQSVLADAVAQVELAALGLADLSAVELVAWSAAATWAATAAQYAAWSVEYAADAAEAAARAGTAAWAEEAAEWAAAAASSSARSAAKAGTKAKAAAKAAAARLYFRAAELLRKGE